MFNFTPESDKPKIVPFYEDAKEKGGWKGQATTKSVDRLQSEISEAINRLGGIVSGFQKGTFKEANNAPRDGFQVHYAVKSPTGHFVPGSLPIAALPVRDKWNDSKKDKSLRMALYMLREALEGMWLLQQLSPGFAALMPWMIGKDGKTVTQLWAENSVMSNLLPSPDTDFVEAEIVGENK